MFKILLLSVIALAASEPKSHVHGQGQVNIAIQGKRGQIEFRAPAEALFGFEHEARSKADKRKKDQALKSLDERMSEMVVLDESSRCQIRKEISEVIQGRKHIDVEAEFIIECENPLAGSSIELNFRKVFPRLKKVKVDLIADDVQKSIETTKNGEIVELK